MEAMTRRFCVLALLGLGLLAPCRGEETVEAELKAVRQVLELQSKKLDLLTEEVAQLRQRMADSNPGKVGATAPIDNVPAPDAAPPPEPPRPDPAHAEAPRAEATGGGIKHLVAKGETLTSIAKHYNVPLVELQKANKNLNERKMQIGQVLNIPAPSTPESATPAPDKKENP